MPSRFAVKRREQCWQTRACVARSCCASLAENMDRIHATVMRLPAVDGHVHRVGSEDVNAEYGGSSASAYRPLTLLLGAELKGGEAHNRGESMCSSSSNFGPTKSDDAALYQPTATSISAVTAAEPGTKDAFAAMVGANSVRTDRSSHPLRSSNMSAFELASFRSEERFPSSSAQRALQSSRSPSHTSAREIPRICNHRRLENSGSLAFSEATASFNGSTLHMEQLMEVFGDDFQELSINCDRVHGILPLNPEPELGQEHEPSPTDTDMLPHANSSPRRLGTESNRGPDKRSTRRHSLYSSHSKRGMNERSKSDGRKAHLTLQTINLRPKRSMSSETRHSPSVTIPSMAATVMRSPGPVSAREGDAINAYQSVLRREAAQRPHSARSVGHHDVSFAPEWTSPMTPASMAEDTAGPSFSRSISTKGSLGGGVSDLRRTLSRKDRHKDHESEENDHTPLLLRALSRSRSRHPVSGTVREEKDTEMESEARFRSRSRARRTHDTSS
ncbi:hypothetical protein FVE85_6321 [Porphyridium purpureum]|uniref:Uncharacterized protein n=1 Tax=Porphyridium purpureum TaxID=35688 RepID=A0A5J4Z4Y2_PORPP|nr:hypothetical protein FVE85_6321 [Porphyridium purpureum]|eukprot:POR3744..scf295_1